MTATSSPAEVVLRHLHPGDLDQILVLERTLFGAGAWTAGMFREELDGWGRWYIVAAAPPVVEPVETTQNQPAQNHSRRPAHSPILGYAGLWFDGEISQVMTIGVAPSAQRAGIGAALLSAIVEQSRELGAESVLLEVRVDNSPAIALYERFGFETIALRKRYYQPEDVDALVMRLPLVRGLG